MDSSARERLRERYRPYRVRILFVGEAPERPARINAVRIELQHLVVELLSGCRRFRQPVEIVDVLPGLFDDAGIVLVFGSPCAATTARGLSDSILSSAEIHSRRVCAFDSAR